MARTDAAETEDRLLGGRVRLTQPAQGYRSAIDPVLLAAAVPARPGETVLDVGAGSGAVSLCLAARVPGLAITALERDPELAALARRNAVANGAPVTVLEGDLGQSPPELGRGFDHAVANPPYLDPERSDAPPHPGRAAAHVADAADPQAWIGFMADRVRRKGRLTLIHRADRLDALLAGLAAADCGEAVVYPLWPRHGRPAVRVIVSARTGVRGPLRLAAGLVLHAAADGYSDAAEAVLRDAAGLVL